MSCCTPRNTPNRPMRKGTPGESAYEFWVSHQPEGADTSECAYLQFMQGVRIVAVTATVTDIKKTGN